jgi:hypothetical protein
MTKLVKAIFLIVFVCGLNLVVYAQDEQTSMSAGPFSFGVRAGFVTSYFSHEQPHTGYKIGFTIGGLATYAFSDNFSIQAEPAYLQQGGTFMRFTDNTRFGDTSPYAIYTTSSDITLHNIDLPVLAKYSLPAFGNFKPNVVLGPAIAYTVTADEHYTKTYSLSQVFFTATGYKFSTSEYQHFQFGATAGIGGEVSLGTKRLLIDLRYRYGITPAKKGFSYVDFSGVQGDLRTHSISFAVGIGF